MYLLVNGMLMFGLQAINREALDLRDSTKGMLLRQEVQVMNAGKSRERQLMELKSVTSSDLCSSPTSEEVIDHSQSLLNS